MLTPRNLANSSVRKNTLQNTFQGRVTLPTAPVKTVTSTGVVNYIPPQIEGSLHWDNRENKLYISDGAQWLLIHTDPTGSTPIFGKEAIFEGDIKVTGVIDPTGVLFTEGSVKPVATTSTEGLIWVRDDSPNVLIFTDDVGTDHVLTGTGSLQNLTSVLLVGNTTGGTNIEMTSGDSIISNAAISTAIQLTAANAVGGVDIDSGTGGINVDTTGGVSIDSADTTNLSMAANNAADKNVTIAATNAGAGAGRIILTGDDIRISAFSGGGTTLAAIDNDGDIIRSSQSHFNFSVTTSGTTPDSTSLIPTVNPSSNFINIFIAARQTNGSNESAMWSIKAAWKNSGGLTQLSVDDVIFFSEAGSVTWTVVTGSSGSNITITVTGAAGDDVSWEMTADQVTV